ncbi:MAG: UDP-N-acetylmuramoyl-L-alanyl-D-glutamate--2,6-diaminopimelate ligase [Candidatus Omnitrophica bacterium]|nr:UDP-N-acetylmuramoyl-L-alanyl-D-glutamate--2,6-diaminopimelate ligase [Candidatus Omnitrophota bacterium]
MRAENGMPLSQLLRGIAYTSKGNVEGIHVRAITSDSKQVREGDLFVAIQGAKQDGHHYLEEAIHRGAVAVVVERGYSHPSSKVVQVSDTKNVLSHLAAVYYRNPSKEMRVVGVTGTNGKTTITYLLEELFREEGVGVLGTISYRMGARVIPAVQTTPGALEVHALLRKMADARCRYAALEVSSHALDQCRVAHVDFQTGIFTNLTQDHLDYHKTMEAYGQAKLKLFKGLPSTSCAIVNGDDPFSDLIIPQTKAEVFSYGFNRQADIRAESVSLGAEGTAVEISFPVHPGVKGGLREKIVLQSRLIGRHNAYNLLAGFATGLTLGKFAKEIKERLERLSSVPGRLEEVSITGNGDERVRIFVDYAHTPDGLKQALTTLKGITKGRLWVVFGCGGDRDRGKRAQMGKIAAELADVVLITSDNPRNEQPEDIIKEILEGARSLGARKAEKVRSIVDRSTAIREAILSSAEQDTLLIAGKGHENYQIFKDVTIPFGDGDEARRWLEERGRMKGAPCFS